MERIDDLKELETPCFILDQQEFARSVDGFRNALGSNFSKVVIGYSVKTNSLPYCLKLARDKDCFAEVVSFDEYHLAELCGFDKKHVIYNGPMKDERSFVDAIVHGAVVNIETKRELDWLKALPADGCFKVGVRLNCDISKISPEDADGDNDDSRFGFSDETSEFLDAIQAIERLANVKLGGLHLHRTAHSRSVRFYERLIRHACSIIKKYVLDIDYLDIGGGYFGIFPNKPTYQDYADGFYKVLREEGLGHLTIIVEPGNALVASCFQFVSEIIDVKHVGSETYVLTTDGSRNDIDPFFHKAGYIHELATEGKNKVVKKQIVGGCTCLEYDRLFTIYDKPLMDVGDRILYKNVGAYTMCLSPLFIRYFPKVYLRGEEGVYKLVRRQWTAEDYISESNF